MGNSLAISARGPCCDTGNDIFALRVGEKSPYGSLTGCRIRVNAQPYRIVALVAEHHRLHVDRGTESSGSSPYAGIARAGDVQDLNTASIASGAAPSDIGKSTPVLLRRSP